MKTYTICFLVIFSITTSAWSQIKTSVDVKSPYWEDLKKTKEDYQSLKKAYREQIKSYQEQYRNTRFTYDSLKTSLKHVDKINRAQIIDSLLQSQSISSEQREALIWIKKGKPTKKEFVQIVLRRTSRVQEIQTLQKEWYQLKTVTDSLDQDSVLLHYQNRVEERLKDALAEEGLTEALGEGELTLKELQSLPEQYQAQFNDQLSSLEEQTQVLKEARLPKLPRQLNINHFADKAPQLQKGLNKVAALKAKYSKVLNSQDLSSAVKKNSLEESSTGERLVWGGYFNVDIGNPTLLDLSPSLGYRLNRRWTAATGVTFRTKFGRGRRDAPSVAGYRGFLQYEFIDSFVGHTEYESLYSFNGSETNEDIDNRPTHSAFLGLGKTLKISKTLKSQVLFLYDVNHREDGPNRRPWVVRFGILF